MSSNEVARQVAVVLLTVGLIGSCAGFALSGKIITSPALLTFSAKYVVTSGVTVTTSTSSLTDDSEAVITFSLSSSKTVLVIYQANSIGSITCYAGMQNAINIDGADYANSWDSPYSGNMPVRNCIFWVGTLSSGSHTVKGRFASNVDGLTTQIHNRVLIVMIFNGDSFYYVDNPTPATASSTTFVDDPKAKVTYTPPAACKALILYNVANAPATTESAYGKKVAINVGGTEGGTDYAQAEKSNYGYQGSYPDSVFTAYALSLPAAQVTIKGRFANAGAAEAVTVSRRQFAVLFLDDSTLLDIVTSTTRVSTTSNALVDDPQAAITRTTTDKRELLVVAVGTKRHGTSSYCSGECYGIKIDGNDRAHSRGSPYDPACANSVATAYAELLTPGSHTIKGRFSNNFGANTAIIDARQVIALWFVSPNAPPNAPTLNSPATNARFNPSASVTFSWTFSDPDSGDSQSAYQLQIGNSGFTTIYSDTGKVTSTSMSTTRTIPSTVGVYYWRVKTWDSAGAEGTWSSGRAIIVDAFNVQNIKVSDLRTDAGSNVDVWFKVTRAYDGALFDGAKGTVYVNGTAATWDSAQGAWKVTVSQSNVVGAVYAVSSISDAEYGITTVNSMLSFDGVDDYVRVTNNASLNPTSAVTISIWFKTSVVHDGALVWKAQSTYNPAYGIAYFGSTYGSILGRIVDSSGNLHAVGFSWVADGGWHNLIMTYDGTIQRIYLDGVLKNSLSWTGTIITTNYDLMIGDRETSHMYFNGLIDEVRIYNRALSANEIQQLYQGTYTSTTGLVLYFSGKMANGVLYDESGNGNHGTIYGATPDFTSRPTPKIVWDRIKVVSLTADDARRDVGSTATLTVQLVYEYDNTYITSGSFTLSGRTLTYSGSNGYWTATDTKTGVQAVIYNSVSGTDGLYGLTVVNMNGRSVTVIWDRVKIVEGGVTDVDTKTGGKVWYKAVYEYDGVAFTSGTLYLNGQPMTFEGDRWTYAFPYQMSGNQAVFHITGIQDTLYGLTVINNAVGDIVLNWATAQVTIGKP